MNEIHTLTVNGETFLLQDAEARTGLDNLAGEVVINNTDRIEAEQALAERIESLSKEMDGNNTDRIEAEQALSQRLDAVEERAGKDPVDDTAVSPKAWSSHHTVDMLCPPFAETGAVVTCQPVAGSSLSAVSETAGDSDKVQLWHGGKNLLNCGRIELRNHAHSDLRSFAVPLPAGTYTLSASIEKDADYTSVHLFALYYADGTNSLSNLPNGGGARTFTSGKAITGIRVYANATATAGNAIYTNIQVEAGNAATSYEPYRGEVLTADLDKGYTGSYDWVSGVLTGNSGETVQLIPQSIFALPGVNCIYSDAGATTVTGRSDLPATVEKIVNAIIALGGNV